jgi:hypothetical protein
MGRYKYIITHLNNYNIIISYSFLSMKNKYFFAEQNSEQDLGDIGFKTRLSSPRDSKFSPK